jgi:opacity protein-like surface antigen
MKKLVLIAVFLLGFSVIVMAEDTPKVEVFGGFSFVKVDTATALKGSIFNWRDLNLKGFDASIAVNANKWGAVVADFGANYGVVLTNPSNPISGAWMDYGVQHFVVGPKFTLYRGKASPFVHLLFGYAKVKGKVSGVTSTQKDFAMAMGGGLDINLNSKVAIRAVQLDSLMVRSPFRGNFSGNLRLSTGVVLKLGKS